VFDVVTDLFDEGVYRAERAAADGLFGDDPEPGLDPVELTRSDWVKWKLTLGVAGQPRLHVRVSWVDRLSSTPTRSGR
jgi:hypothetical protein